MFKNIFIRIHTILFSILLCISIGCGDEDLNNTVKPATEIVVHEKDNTLRITDYEKGPFEYIDHEREGVYMEGVYVAKYQGKEVWLYGFAKGDLVIGTVIDEPDIIDEWIEKVTNVRTQKKQNVRFLEIKLPAS